MKKKYLYILGGLIILLLGLSSFFLSKRENISNKVHYHAGFIVFENEKKLDFSDTKYMFIKPCTLDGEENEEMEDSQLEKAHLHDNVGDVIHIEEEGAVWSDLFTNIEFYVDYSKVTAFINGQKVSGFETQSIKSNDSLVLFIDYVDEKLLSQAVTTQYIEDTAKKSTTCGD